MKAKLLLVEDEKNFGMLLRDYLVMNGFLVELCEDGMQGLKKFRSDTFDLCIVDVMMPRKDGFTLASEIRAIDRKIPLLFLTARTMKEDMIKAYRIGADDYITKPFDSELLLYKLNAILNRREQTTADALNHYTIGTFTFQPKLRILKHLNHPDIKLSPKEAALLQLLCEHQNDVLPREKALKQIWKDENYFTGRSMDVYIVKLRKYLQPDNSVEISNLHGNGYSLMVKQ